MFNIEAIGGTLSLYKTSINNKTMIDGKSNIPEEELKNYKQYDENDNIFIREKEFFEIIKSRLNQKYKFISEKANIEKYGFNDFSDSYNSSTFQNYSAYATEIAATLEQIDKPYFGRLDLSKYPHKTIYIGDRALSEINNIIYDWREPVCQIYYTKNTILYEKYGLELIRKFDIHKGSFCGYFDSYIKNKSYTNDNNIEIVDDFLIAVIKRQRENPKIHDIIQTIQNTQYEIISDELEKNMIIQGCAGSGKTMVLMHRLSYAVYNKKGLERKNIKIITPNKNLNLELTDLAQKLQLLDIERYTLSEYYTELIKKYCKKNRIFTIPNLQSNQYKSTLYLDDELDIIQLNALYKIDFGSEFAKFEYSEKEVSYLCNLVNEFISEEKVLVCDSRYELLREFDNALKDLNNILKETKRVLRTEEDFDYDNEFKKSKSEFEKIKSKFNKNINHGIQEIEKHIKSNTKRIESVDDIKTAEGLLEKFKDIVSVFDSDELYNKIESLVISNQEKRYIENNNYLEMEPVKKETYKDIRGNKIETVIMPIDYYKQNVREKRNRFVQIHSLMIKIELYIESLKQNSKPCITDVEIDSNKFINRFNDLTNIIESLRNFQNKKDNSYITYIWKVYINQLKHQYGISTTKKYQFELYSLLLYLYQKFGVIDNEDKYLFIDEGQDFLESELAILTLINKDPTINIFGDNAQRIRNISNTYYFDTAKEKNFRKYDLDVNYRNCKEVTEHINKKCEKYMKPVGLNGSVKLIQYEELTSNIFDNMLDRKVLIVKDEQALEMLLKKVDNFIESRINIIFNSEINFLKNKLNVLNVKSSKGLEFKEVVVFDYNLTNKEYYIACSRALEKLTIIGS